MRGHDSIAAKFHRAFLFLAFFAARFNLAALILATCINAKCVNDRGLQSLPGLALHDGQRNVMQLTGRNLEGPDFVMPNANRPQVIRVVSFRNFNVTPTLQFTRRLD
jgi:hypothetical protein